MIDNSLQSPESSKAKTILKLLQGCNSLKKLRKIHAFVITNGLQHHPAISTKLLHFCAVSVSGSLPYAVLLFRHHILNPQTDDWNSIIRGFSQSPNPLKAIFYYNDMVLAADKNFDCRPDSYTFSFLLRASERTKAERKCREVHGSIIRRGYEADVVVCTNLVKSYCGNGLVETARKVFDEMPVKDLVSWNSMILCYSQAGFHHEALRTYDLMRNENVGVDGFTLVGLLSSCAHVGAQNIGVEMHRMACKREFLRNVFVGNALINMYAKCGNLDAARSVFDSMIKRDVLTWNSMVVGYGGHGLGKEAIEFFEKMLMAGFHPNSITFLGLLCGCNHQGLVEEGVEYFHRMTSKYNIKPGIKHYGCLVDLFGRAGKLEKALEVIKNCPSQHDPVLWRTLLGSCKIHKNVEMGEIAMRSLVQVGASNAGDCILLASIYQGVNNVDGVARMRKMIKSWGIRTTPGWSWIEVADQVHKFVVDDKSHPHTNEIYNKLREVIHVLSQLGYVEEGFWGTSTSSYHSEKLAIAFGIARTPEGTCLRIVKNLRVCGDCHSFTKFVSKAFNREIVVRDRVRFHHFKGGLCSCNDYW